MAKRKITISQPGDINTSIAPMAMFFALILIIGGLFLFFINNYTSAVGWVGLTDGKVAPVGDNILLEWAKVIDGGRFGLLMGITVGLIINSFEFGAIILRDKPLYKDNPKLAFLINAFDFISRIFDIITAAWYTMNGYTYFPDSSISTILVGLATMFFHAVVVVAFLTVGPEVFLVYGIRMMAIYGKAGILGIFDSFVGLYKLMIDIQLRIENITKLLGDDDKKSNKSDDDEDEIDEKPKPRQTNGDNRPLGKPGGQVTQFRNQNN